jgi:hypothetical protein
LWRGHPFDCAEDRLALVPSQRQDAGGTQGRDGLATIEYPVSRDVLYESR